MALITTQQITKYYETYLNTELTFSKDIIRTLGMDPRQIFVKCAEGQWPCIINSSSLSLARVIVGTKSGAFQQMTKKEPPIMNLRYWFTQPDGTSVSFFISCKVTQVMPYMNSKDLAIITLTFTQRPPDDLIEKLGHLIDANTNALRRKEERIVITKDSSRKLGLHTEECSVIIQSVPRRCILHDISFGGAKVFILGLAQFLKGKEAQLNLEFDEPHEVIQLKGIIAETSAVEGRKDIVAVSIQFNDATVSLSYKIHINNYITTARKADLDGSAAQAEAQQNGAQ